MAGPLGIPAAIEAAAIWRQEGWVRPEPLFMQLWDRWGELYHPPSYPLSPNPFQAEKAMRKIMVDCPVKK